jgi:hypothetical protein
MNNTINEKIVRSRLANAKLNPESDARDALIMRAVRSIIDMGSVYYVLTDTPEQTEDIFVVLVDDRLVVSFELERDNPDAEPSDVGQYTIEQYRAAPGEDIDQIELQIALELARHDLRRTSETANLPNRA